MVNINSIHDKIANVNLINFELTNEHFQKNTEIYYNKKDIVNSFEMDIELGYNTDECKIALKTNVTVTRKLRAFSSDDRIQSELNATFVSLYKETENNYIIECLNSLNAECEEIRIIANKLFELAYPKIKKHIQYIFKTSNMRLSLPDELEVGE